MIVNVLSLLELQSIITTKKTCSRSLQLQLGKSGIGKLQEHLFNPIRMLDDKVIPRTMCLFFQFNHATAVKPGKVCNKTLAAPKFCFKTCVAMKFVDDDDDYCSAYR